jgi:hypothetical protein
MPPQVNLVGLREKRPFLAAPSSIGGVFTGYRATSCRGGASAEQALLRWDRIRPWVSPQPGSPKPASSMRCHGAAALGRFRQSGDSIRDGCTIMKATYVRALIRPFIRHTLLRWIACECRNSRLIDASKNIDLSASQKCSRSRAGRWQSSIRTASSGRSATSRWLAATTPAV